ncbi:hypothetical protein BBJ28_00020958 [Nothophytophthora sp. Chile5]|nr:hypothetical protein BBJ28_00020958 [Nothophytophthora sp. Chile5]
MVHVEDFNLFDSMSALELMDPKMDSGMLVNGAPPQSIADRLADGRVPLEFSSARDVLATLDELFRCEAGWLNGLPLAQSLLTSVYMHRDPLNALVAQLLTPLEDLMASEADVRAVLAAKVGSSAKDSLLLVMCVMCLATAKTGNMVRDAALRADIYEEEDFSPGNGFDLGALAPLSVEALELMLQVTQERLEVLLAQSKTALSSKKSSKKKHGKKGAVTATANSESSATGSAAGYDPLYPNARVGGLLCEAFIRRIRLRRELLATYAGLGLADGALDLQQAREGFQHAQELTRELSTEQLELDPECFSGKALGFDPTISRLLLSGSPPRDVKVPSTDEALDVMKKVLAEMTIACSPAEWTCMEDLRIFLTEFSKQQPNIIARSYVLLFLYADKKIYAKFNFMDWLSASMVLNGVPSVLLSTQEGVLFSSRSIETVYESLKVFLHNRSRQRARIEYLLEEWTVLQVEATAVDEKFTTEMAIPNLNFTWTFMEKMKQIMPSAHRHAPASTEDSSDEATATPPPPPTEAPSTRSSKKSRSKHKKHNGTSSVQSSEVAEPVREPIEPTKARFLREIQYTEMLRSLMRAFFQLASALEREGLVQVKPPMYSAFTIRFQHRFAAFQNIHYPAALTYEDFCKNSDFSPYDLELIYKSAEECFKAARTHGEALLTDAEGVNTMVTSGGDVRVRGAEIAALLKVAISNCVRLAQRSQNAVANGSGRNKKPPISTSSTPAAKTHMEFDFSIHPHFPVVMFPPP